MFDPLRAPSIPPALQRLGPEDSQFIYDAAAAHCLDIATHRHGCCVLQVGGRAAPCHPSACCCRCCTARRSFACAWPRRLYSLCPCAASLSASQAHHRLLSLPPLPVAALHRLRHQPSEACPHRAHRRALAHAQPGALTGRWGLQHMCCMSLWDGSTGGLGPRASRRPHAYVPPLRSQCHTCSPCSACSACSACPVLQDAFGNYVVQYVLELGHPETSAMVMTNLTGHYSELATQKFRWASFPGFFVSVSGGMHWWHALFRVWCACWPRKQVHDLCAWCCCFSREPRWCMHALHACRPRRSSPRARFQARHPCMCCALRCPACLHRVTFLLVHAHMRAWRLPTLATPHSPSKVPLPAPSAPPLQLQRGGEVPQAGRRGAERAARRCGGGANELPQPGPPAARPLRQLRDAELPHGVQRPAAQVGLEGGGGGGGGGGGRAGAGLGACRRRRAARCRPACAPPCAPPTHLRFCC